jgi:broad specificity phosphatase PhoE
VVEIYVCRHGQSQANAQGLLAGHIDSPLNQIGRKQANELGQLAKKAGLRFDHIYCSPLSRAKETAEIIARNTGSPSPQILKELIERNFGVLTGKPYSDIPKLASELLEADKIGYFLNGDGVESFPDALIRALLVLDKIKTAHKTGKVLLATHGDFGMMLFAAFHRKSWRDTLTHFHFGNSELLLLKEDSHHKPHVFKIDQRGVL